MRTLEEITYEAGRGALADQESLVAGVRQRTGTLLAAHALVASFLGSATLRVQGLSALGWVALVALAFGLLAVGRSGGTRGRADTCLANSPSGTLIRCPLNHCHRTGSGRFLQTLALRKPVDSLSDGNHFAARPPDAPGRKAQAAFERSSASSRSRAIRGSARFTLLVPGLW
jgi:hypothetical protein